VRVEGQGTFNSTPQMLNAALAGLGLAYLPEGLAQPHIAKGRLKRVLAYNSVTPIPFSECSRARRFPATKGAHQCTNCSPSQMQRGGADSLLVLFDIVNTETASGGAPQRLAGSVNARVAPSALRRACAHRRAPPPRFRLRRGCGGPGVRIPPAEALAQAGRAREEKGGRHVLPFFPPPRSGGGVEPGDKPGETEGVTYA
jgi:hypothetical protein